MPDGLMPAAMQEHYARGLEMGRLAEPIGQLEFERTKEIIARHLPPPPAVVADIGGGPGRYALWLAHLGYEVLHRDLMPLHVEQLREASRGKLRIQTAVGDALQLDLANESADAALLLVPCITWRTAKTGCGPWPRHGAWSVRGAWYSWRRFPAGPPGWTAFSGRACTSRSPEPKPSYRRLSGRAACHRCARARFARTFTVPASCEPNLRPAAFKLLTWSVWKARPICLMTWRLASPSLKIAAWCWRLPAPWNEFPNCSASARICWRRPEREGVASQTPPENAAGYWAGPTKVPRPRTT